MSYKVAYFPSFGKDIKSFKKQPLVSEEIKQKVLAIIKDPTIGSLLVGNWSGFQKISFHKKPELRLIYKVYPCCIPSEGTLCLYEDETEPVENCSGLIDFAFIRTREECNSLYSQSGKYSKQFKRD